MGVTAMFPMIVSSTDSVKGRIPEVFGSRKGGEDLPYGRSEPMPGSCKWYWNIRIQVLERDRLVLHYRATLHVFIPYTELLLDRWLTQIRRRALELFKKRCTHTTLRQCRVVMDTELSSSNTS
jgi:hypothetical protein